MSVEKLLSDLRRVEKAKKYKRGSYNQKEDLKRKRGYKCDYCKQKNKNLNVRLERFHRISSKETIQNVADRYNTNTQTILNMNEKIFSEFKWKKGLMINIPGDLNVFIHKNGVVSCKECSLDKRKKKLTHPEYVYHLLNKRKTVRDEVTKEFREMIYLRDRYLCHYCTIENIAHNSVLTLDHIVPVVDGGESTEENVVTSCYYHNKEKGTTPYGIYVDKLIKRSAVPIN